MDPLQDIATIIANRVGSGPEFFRDLLDLAICSAERELGPDAALDIVGDLLLQPSAPWSTH